MATFEPTNLPAPLMTGEPNSFAYNTIAVRIPPILRQVLADYAGIYPPAIVQAVEGLLRR